MPIDLSAYAPIVPSVYPLPWPKLNSLLAGHQHEAAVHSWGGIAAGESMMICGEARSFRTTTCVFLAAHLIERYSLRVAFFSSDVTSSEAITMRERVICARRFVAQPRAEREDDARTLDVYPAQYAFDTAFESAPPDVGAIIADMGDRAFTRERMMDLALLVRRTCVVRNIPIFCTFQLNHASRRGGLDCLPTEVIHTTADHVVILDPTISRQYVVLTLAASRRGAVGAVLLDSATLGEVL